MVAINWFAKRRSSKSANGFRKLEFFWSIEGQSDISVQPKCLTVAYIMSWYICQLHKLTCVCFDRTS